MADIELYPLFFKIVLAAYLVSSLGYIASLWSKKILVARASTWVLFSAFLLQASSFVLRGLKTGYSPVINLHDSLSFFAWAMAGIYLAFQLKTTTRVLGAFVSPVAFLLMTVSSIGLGGEVHVPEILKGSLVPVHVTLSLLGEALFAVACFAGALYLIQDHFIKHKRVNSLSRVLPPLKDLDRINHLTLLWGFPLLTLGVIVGAIWARTAWGSHWNWDPKQVWTATAWLFYAALLHQRLAIGWSGRKAALLSIAAFIFLLFAFIGVGLLFPTVHRFL